MEQFAHVRINETGLYLKQKAHFEPIEEDHITIDTMDKDETILQTIYDQIFR